MYERAYAWQIESTYISKGLWCWYDEKYFQLQVKMYDGPKLSCHTVEITGIYSHSFLARNSWK